MRSISKRLMNTFFTRKCMCLPRYIYLNSRRYKAVNEFQVIYALSSPFSASFISRANRTAQRGQANSTPNNVYRTTIHRNRETCKACLRCVGLGMCWGTRNTAILWRFPVVLSIIYTICFADTIHLGYLWYMWEKCGLDETIREECVAVLRVYDNACWQYFS